MKKNITLDYFIDKALETKKGKVPTLVITCPYEADSIVAIKKAIKLELIKALFVGEKKLAEKAAKEADFELTSENFFDAKDDADAARITMELLRDDKAQMLMKGLIDTSLLLKTLLVKDYGLRTGKLFSHAIVSFNDDFDKYYIITDAGMNIAPTLEQKKEIIENSVLLAHALGIKEPKVACLTAKEKVYDKMPATLDAAALQKMNQDGIIKNCIVSGPLQLDNAINEHSAKVKGIEDPVAGKADILLVPDIEAGNIFSKGLYYLCNWAFAGIVIGAKIPIVLTSRSSDERDQISSICLACSMANFKE